MAGGRRDPPPALLDASYVECREKKKNKSSPMEEIGSWGVVQHPVEYEERRGESGAKRLR